MPLGKISKLETDSDGQVRQIYEGGSACPPYGIRRSIIQFLCGKTVGISSIQEPKVCEYFIWISAPDFCSHPAFAQSAPVMQPVTSSIQSWFLELVEVSGFFQLHIAKKKKLNELNEKGDDSSLTCSVQYNLMVEDGSPEPKMDSFALLFDSDQDVSSFIVRKANFHFTNPEEIDLIPGGIQSTNKFENSLIFAKITRMNS